MTTKREEDVRAILLADLGRLPESELQTPFEFEGVTYTMRQMLDELAAHTPVSDRYLRMFIAAWVLRIQRAQQDRTRKDG